MGRLIDEAMKRMFAGFEDDLLKDKQKELINGMKKLSGALDELKITLEERGATFNDPSSASVLRNIQFEMRELRVPLLINAARIHALVLEAQFFFFQVHRLVEAYDRDPDPVLAPRVASHINAAVAFGNKVAHVAAQFLLADARRTNLLMRIDSRLTDEEECEWLESVIRAEGLTP